MEKSTIILGIIALALAGYAASILSSSGAFSSEAKDPTVSLEFLPDFDKDKAERIEIWEPDMAAQRNGEEGARKSIALVRKPTVAVNEDGEEEAKLEWIVESSAGYPARQEKVTELLDLFDSFQGGDIRSRNPESHSSLQVDDSGKEVKITDEDGKLVGHFYAGKMAGGMRSTFVRKEGADVTVLVPGQVSAKLNTFKNNWLDNELLKLDHQLIKSVSIDSKKNGTIRFEKNMESGEWKAVEPEEFVADTRQIDSAIRPITALRFLDVVEPAEGNKPEHGLDPPRLTVRLKLSDETEHTLVGGSDKDDRSAYATVDDKGFVFEVSKYTLEKLDRSAEDYRPKAPSVPGAAQPIKNTPTNLNSGGKPTPGPPPKKQDQNK